MHFDLHTALCMFALWNFICIDLLRVNGQVLAQNRECEHLLLVFC